MKPTLSFSMFILLIFYSVNLNAQTTTSDSLVHVRIQYIQIRLNQSKHTVDGWWYGWLGGYSAATVAQGVVTLTSTDKNTRQDMALGAVTTFLGATLQVLTPLNTGHAANIISQLPDSTPELQVQKLRIAEQLFKSNALTEKSGRSWEIHALNEAVNLSSGLITWLGYKRTVWDGVANFLLNSAITETQIWTQPTRTLKDYEEYCRKYKSGFVSEINKIEPEFYLRTGAGNVSLSIVF